VPRATQSDDVVHTTSPPLGRRERKRLATRRLLVDTALELFDQHGFDDVTVADIAAACDLDPSTFFRHIGSKDAVLFTDLDEFADRIGPALAARPTDESVLDAIVNAMLDLGRDRTLRPELEMLRTRLRDSSPALRTQDLVHREHLAEQLTAAIGARVQADPDDPTPYLAATLWVAAFTHYRRRHLQAADSNVPDGVPQPSVEAVLRSLRPLWPTGPGWQ
jgi:AcrR family transcriptional regulator